MKPVKVRFWAILLHIRNLCGNYYSMYTFILVQRRYQSHQNSKFYLKLFKMSVKIWETSLLHCKLWCFSLRTYRFLYSVIHLKPKFNGDHLSIVLKFKDQRLFHPTRVIQMRTLHMASIYYKYYYVTHLLNFVQANGQSLYKYYFFKTFT